MKKELINEAKLNLACGQIKVEGYFGVDIAPCETVDAVVDLEEYPWPIESDSAEDIICSHYVEHTSDLIKFMEEVYRILKPEGKIRIIAPYYASIRAIQDPTHVRSIGEVTFMYFNKDWRALNKLEHYTTTTCNFDFVYGYNMQQEFLNKHVEQRTYAMKHYWNVIDDIDITLTKK